MALRNINNSVLKAFYQLLSGNIGYNVYRTDVPANENTHHVILRVESETRSGNSANHVTQPVIITEVVTKFKAIIDDGKVYEIDDAIAQLLFPTNHSHNLPAQSGIDIPLVQRTDATLIQEDDETYKYHRLITRNLCRVIQT